MQKYCSLCKQPLANNNCIVCDKCGKPTTPIDIFDKMASDNCLDSKEKRMLELIGILNIISCVISIIEWLILTAVFGNIRAALQEQMNAGLIVETAENLAAYESTLSMCGLISTLGIIVIVEQLAALFFSVMILLKRAWAVQVSRVLYIINIIIHFLSGNIISAIITIYIVVKLNAIISKMDGGAEYTTATLKVEKEEAELAADPTEWRCKSCGYFALFGSGSLKEKVNFNSMAVFTTYEEQYEYGIVGLVNNRMYHTGILSDKQMFDVLYSFVRS